MIIKTDPDQFQNYLLDASNYKGECSKVYVPETTDELKSLLKELNNTKIDVTISGNGTGVTGSRVPHGGAVVSVEKLNKIIELNKEKLFVRVMPAVILKDLQDYLKSENLVYPPDPTERNCFVGGTVATNASGARTFKFGATRDFVLELKIVLADGEELTIERGKYFAASYGGELITDSGKAIKFDLPTYKMPATKNASGYFCKENMDLIDLFIGSEGTLGVISEIKLKLIPYHADLISSVVFFETEDDALNFVDEARTLSRNIMTIEVTDQINASGLEFFDAKALTFLRKDFPNIPSNSKGAVWFEQEYKDESLIELWLELITKHNGDLETAWIASSPSELEKFKDFRHAISWKVNEYIAQNNMRKVGTDTSVPVDSFREYYKWMKNIVEYNKLDYVVYGHFGDCHPHLNMLPKDEKEFLLAKEIYSQICDKAIELNGTVSAEHGIGKFKKDYLLKMYGEPAIKQMASLKLVFDPNAILCKGNIFEERFLV